MKNNATLRHFGDTVLISDGGLGWAHLMTTLISQLHLSSLLDIFFGFLLPTGL